MKKNKLLLVTPYFYPQQGGLQNYAFNIAKGLIKDYGWDVVVVTSNENNKEKKVETIDKIKVYRLPLLFKISNTPINPFWYFDIKNIIKIEKPDIVNAHGPVPFIADVSALAAGSIPFVMTYHSGTMKKNRFLPDILIGLYENVFLKFTIKKATKIILASNFVKRTMLKKYSYKSIVINPGVDTSIFKPLNIRKKSENTVLFICRYANMHKMKGLDTILEAMKTLPYAKLRIIGEKGKMKGKNIEYVGIKTGNDLVEEMQNSSVLVLPSLAHMESFGMVLVEAMACKIPVIGTDIGGIPEIIDSRKNGIIIPPNNSKALAKALNEIFTNKEFALTMGEGGYHKVINKFQWTNKVRETNLEFQKVIQNTAKHKLLKVLVICKEFPPHVQGGLGVHYKELVNELKNYCEVELICARDNFKTPKNEYFKNLHIYRILIPSIFPLNHIVFNLVAFIKGVSTKKDITHICSPFGLLNVIFKDSITVVKLHTIYPMQKGNFLYKRIIFPIASFVDMLLIQRSDFVISTSDFMKKNIIKNYKISPNKISVIYNGINKVFFEKNNHKKNLIRNELNISRDAKVVLYIGRFVPRKGALKLIHSIPEIIKKNKNIVFILIGGGFTEGSQYEKDISTTIKRFGLETNIRIIPWIDHKNILKYYETSDIFIHPATFEPFGNVILEAMAMGLPVITTKSGGPEEIVQENGIVLDKNTPSSISKGILKLIKQKKLRQQLSIKGIRRAKAFSWKFNAMETISIYKSLLSK